MPYGPNHVEQTLNSAVALMECDEDGSEFFAYTEVTGNPGIKSSYRVNLTVWAPDGNGGIFEDSYTLRKPNKPSLRSAEAQETMLVSYILDQGIPIACPIHARTTQSETSSQI
jgi:hypothetical protein